jgi:PAS domain S-box-containing protein
MTRPAPQLDRPTPAAGPLANLAAIARLPWQWSGLDLPAIAAQLASELRARLQLDLIMVRLCDPGSERVFDASQAGPAVSDAQQAALGAALIPWLQGGDGAAIEQSLSRDGLHALLLRFAGRGHGGLIACSRRTGFPGDDERLLLETAAVQASIALDHLQDRWRIASQRERLRTTLDSIGDAVLCVDADGRVNYLNEIAERSRHSTEAALGQPIEQVLPMFDVDSRTPCEHPVRIALRERRPAALQQPALLIDGAGSERIVEAVANPLRGPRGAVDGVVLALRDVTDMRSAQSMRRERDERLQLFLDNANEYGLVITDPDGRIVEWLGGAEHITGWSAADAVGRSAELLFNAADRSAGRPQQEMAEARDSGRAEDRRWHLRRDGSPFFADGVMVAMRDPGGELRGFGKLFRDATERRHAEQRFARVAAASQAINASLSIECIAQAVADQAREIIGSRWAMVSLTDADGDAGLHPAALSLAGDAEPPEPTELPAQIQTLGQQVCRSGRPQRLGAAVLDALGEAAGWTSGPRQGWLAVPLNGHGGRNLGLLQLIDPLLGEFSDEDESVLTQLAAVAGIGLENARLYESVRTADQRKDEFLATLAHELRNPMAPMRFALEVMRSEASTSSGDREQARAIIERQLGQLVRLVDDLLDVARISTGKLQLRRQRVELAQIIRSAVETSQPTIAAGGHHLELTLPAAPLFIDADPTRLAQVLLNLLNNAAKYSDSGGRIELSAAAEGEQAVIRVRDNGIGIPRPMLRNIFELFSQVERGEQHSQGGLGIGLTLVKRLVEMHGGQVEAHSEGPGQGSEFVLRLPLRNSAGSGEASPSPAPAGQAGRLRKVLVVDDNRDAATSLAFLLNAIGHEARTAHDGSQALVEAEHFLPDVVVLDIGMPGLNGYEVARRLRAMPALRGLSLIALTGWGQEQDRRRSREAGFDHHLVKPADLGELKRLVAGG